MMTRGMTSTMTIWTRCVFDFGFGLCVFGSYGWEGTCVSAHALIFVGFVGKVRVVFVECSRAMWN